MHGNRHKSGESDISHGPLLAVLDLGTNNCRLLIAAPVQIRGSGTGGFKVVDSFSRIVRLGEEGEPDRASITGQPWTAPWRR